MHSFTADILIVDDTVSNLLLLERILTKAGYSTRCLSSAEAAIAEVEMYCPDLIILDVQMSGMSGYEVCAKFKQMSRIQEIPIIFLSALDSPADKVKAFELGAADYVAKPFHTQEILARIRNQLKIQQLQRQLQQQNLKLQTEIQQRIAASEALALSEAKFCTAFRSTPLAISITRLADGCHLDVNDSFLAFSGYSRTEIIGRTSLELNMWQDPSDRHIFIKSLKSQGYVKNQEISIRQPTGETGVGLISAEPITLNGEDCIISVLSNITEQRNIELKLRKSESKFRSLLENVADALFVHDFDGNILDVNQRACQNLGYTKSELLALTIFDIEVKKSPETLKALWRKMQIGQPITVDGINRHKDNYTFPVEARVSVIELEGNLSILGLVRDVSSRVAAEEALRSTEEKYRSIFENAVEGIYQSTRTGEFLNANPALAQIFGYSSAAEMMYSITSIATEIYVDRQRRQDFIDLMDACGTIAGFDSQVYCQDGSIIWISENARSVQDSQGRLLYYEGLVENITTRKLAEAELQKAKEAADQANRAKSEFLSNMSHELRTPLNTILGFTQVLARDHSLSPDHQNSLGIINRSGEHLLSLINDVLEMSKIEAGRTSLNSSNFDLYNLLGSIKEMLHFKAKSKQISLDYTISEEVPRYVSGDEGKLRQVLINLVGNAIKFTDRGSVTYSVTNLSHQDHYHQLKFVIADTGMGIAADELNQLFKAFAQTASGKKSQEGTGLGLPISRQFIQLMGGDISVSSDLGRGTTFSFVIPLLAIALGDLPVLEPSIQRKVIGLAPHQPKYRILIVEDRLENQQVLCRLLEPIGFMTKVAVNGAEGIRLWEEWCPHLIWMDMRMPVMDGYEATRRIKSTPRGQGTVIIALTASAFEEERSQVIAAGCDDFVRKPLQAELIFSKMADYLGIKYIYNNAETITPIAKSEITPADLAFMPSEWLQQLRTAASQLDEDQTLELIDLVSNGNLADRLKELVHTFRFDKLLALTIPNPTWDTSQWVPYKLKVTY